MSIMTITYPARCKDCEFMMQAYVAKKRHYICNNTESPRYTQNIRQGDLVCQKWKPVGYKYIIKSSSHMANLK